MPLDRAVLAIKAFDHQLGRVDSLRNLVDTGVESELDYLRELGGDEDEGIEFYAEEACELTDVDKLFTQLTVIALYATLEIATKRVLAGRCTPKELASAFKFEEVKRLFRKTAGVSLGTLPGFADVNELRCLNNAIKHNGTVSSQLAQYAGWTLGQSIGDVRSAVTRIRPELKIYFSALARAVFP